MADSLGSLILITGPPGAGKTTVARIVAGTFDPCVLLHGDDFHHYIHHGHIPPWQPESERQNQIVIDSTAAAAITYALGGYPVVIDAIIGPWFLDRWLNRLPEGLRLHYVILLPSPAIALQRATERTGPQDLVDAAPVTAMHHAFANHTGDGRHVLDSSDLSAAQTAATVQRLLSTGQLLTRKRDN